MTTDLRSPQLAGATPRRPRWAGLQNGARTEDILSLLALIAGPLLLLSRQIIRLGSILC